MGRRAVVLAAVRAAVLLEWRAAVSALAMASALALIAPPAAASRDAGPAHPSGAYRLKVSLPDSLRAVIAPGAADSTRSWSGPELETAAIRLRDFLAARGAVAATVRLVLVRGEGSAPGTARMEVTASDAREAAVPRPDPAPRPDTVPRPDPVPRPDILVHTTTTSALPPALADSVVSAFRLASGGAVSVDGIAAGLSAGRDALIEAGYYGAEVALDSVEIGGVAPRVHLHAQPGAPAVFESMELPGATATRPAAAASIAGLRPGGRLTPAILTEARDRLAASGLFVEVGDPRLASGALPGGARVVLPVVEERASRFEGALGVAREGGVTGLLDLALGNIAGSGRSAGLRWVGPGQGRSEYVARYREPALLGSRADLALALEAQVAESLYTQTRWSAEVGFRPRGTARASLALKKSGSTYSGLARGSSSTWSLAGRASAGRLRPLLNPTHGVQGSLGAETGRRDDRYPGLPSDRRSLFRGDFALLGAFPLAPRRVLAASARGAGAFFSAGSGGSYPAEELLFVGGSEGLRGHRDRAFAGSRVAAFSIEHRWIQDDRGGRFYLFADAARHDLSGSLAAGTAALPPSLAFGGAAPSLARTVLSPGWEFGYGAGLKTRMASGLVGLDLGFAPGEPLRRGTIHVRYASTW